MTKTENKTRILVADDDPDFLFQMGFILRKAGFEVDAFDNQADAGSYLEAHQPDLAIFDLMMERDDSGFILAYHAKKLYPGLPVILLTAVTAETGRDFKPGNEESKRWIKADLYLEKGLHPDEIIGYVRQLTGS
jgi:two-component system nitrogen regulation response regulator GlnG